MLFLFLSLPFSTFKRPIFHSTLNLSYLLFPNTRERIKYLRRNFYIAVESVILYTLPSKIVLMPPGGESSLSDVSCRGVE